MTPISSLYNSLPSLEEANARFSNREEIFTKLARLLAPYGDKFGVCLVHRHCELKGDERMVSKGNTSSPLEVAECYPERWLASGEAYEFTEEKTEPPPAALFDDFKKIVDGICINGTSVLGLFYGTEAVKKGEIAVESTRERDNEVRWVPRDDCPKDVTPTGWVMLKGHSCLALGCVCTSGGHMKAVTVEVVEGSYGEIKLHCAIAGVKVGLE